MKRLIQTLMLMALCLTATAQNTELMIVTQKDGTSQTFNVREIENVAFVGTERDDGGDSYFTATRDFIVGEWFGQYDGWDKNQRTSAYFRRQLVLSEDGRYHNTIQGMMGGRDEYVDFEREAGTYTFDISSQTVIYTVRTDSLLDFRTGRMMGFTRKHYFDHEVSSYTEKALFTVAPTDEERKWIMQDQTIVSKDDMTTPVTYFMERRSSVGGQLFAHPCTEWGTTAATVRAYMQDYTPAGKYDVQGYVVLTYDGKYQEASTEYYLRNDSLKLADIYIPMAKVSREAVVAQILETYSELFDGIYVSNDNKTLLLLLEDKETGYLELLYSGLDDDSDLHYFNEPYLKWNASPAQVKAEMNNRGYILDEESSSESRLCFEGKDLELFSIYSFESLQLAQVAVVFNQQTASVDDIRDFLTSELEYTYKGANQAQTQFVFLTPDGKSVAIVASTTISGVDLTTIYYVSYEDFVSDVKPFTVNTEQLNVLAPKAVKLAHIRIKGNEQKRVLTLHAKQKIRKISDSISKK